MVWIREDQEYRKYKARVVERRKGSPGRRRILYFTTHAIHQKDQPLTIRVTPNPLDLQPSLCLLFFFYFSFSCLGCTMIRQLYRRLLQRTWDSFSCALLLLVFTLVPTPFSPSTPTKTLRQWQ